MSIYNYRKSWAWAAQILEKDSKTKCIWNCKQGGGGRKRKMHDKSTWSVPDSLCLHRNGFMGFSAEKGTKKLRSWVQKIKLHFHWSQTCKSCLINHSCLKIPINGLKCWGCPYGSSLLHLSNSLGAAWDLSVSDPGALCSSLHSFKWCKENNYHYKPEKLHLIQRMRK